MSQRLHSNVTYEYDYPSRSGKRSAVSAWLWTIIDLTRATGPREMQEVRNLRAAVVSERGEGTTMARGFLTFVGLIANLFRSEM